MKHSAQLVTLSAQSRLAYGSMSLLEPAETRPNFPQSRVAFSKQLSTKHRRNNINGWNGLFNLPKPQLNNTSHTCQHHAEITKPHTFAALIRLSKTTQNLLTFNMSQISSNNSGKHSLLANKHLWTFSHTRLIKFPDIESRAGREQISRAELTFTCKFALT